MIQPADDNAYTPPSPHTTLLDALSHVSHRDYNQYCENWQADGELDVANEPDDGCGIWQAKYTDLHERRLEQLERLKAGDFKSFVHEDPPTYVSYVCKEDPRHRGSHGCGGLADRMTGMISTFFYALLTNRAYLAYWEPTNPLPLEEVFERPHIDWRFNPEEMRTLFDRQNQSMLSYKSINTLNVKWGAIGRLMFPNGANQDFKQLWNASYVEMQSNRGYIVRTFQESDRYPQMLADMGLTKENTFRCLSDYLFRPTVGSRQFIQAYRQLFQMDSVLSIGLQIRTDDSAMVNPDNDTNTLEKWDYFFHCANELREAKRLPQHKHVVYFLITDSVKLRDEFITLNTDESLARRFLGEAFNETTAVITGLPISHVEAKTVATKYRKDVALDNSHQELLDGVNGAIIENWLLSYTDYRLISRQGFGKLAAFHSQSARTTIGLPKVNKHARIDCSNPHSFITFDTLSTWWSLG
ncbi:uncharacterized protein BYT42DRAFT_498374 [Radiomyces spectabilis]|uniref:uncharacterized protein n=1 Tax=Radiomyces spectabilis TaxID=64574 RepID=UPI002220CBF1|nr:uncharacterized protein BYT42DRAFT_498374 [Radiomyces spectabilis]KAI8376520.1 hypothetical protein BYT42DRAFT_498374 [Radiomyces spectabilis]